MRILVPLILLVATVVAEDATDVKDKRGTSSKSSSNANALQEMSAGGKPASPEEVYVDAGDQQQQPIPHAVQPQLQTQYAIPVQYIQQLQQHAQQQQQQQQQQQHHYQQQRPIAYQIPQQYIMHMQHLQQQQQQPIAMVIIPQPAAAAPPPQYQQYSHNALFNQAAQQLLHYYHTHPQARLQLLQGFQGHHMAVQMPQYQQTAPVPQYQPQISAQLALAPASILQSNHLPQTPQYQHGLTQAQLSAFQAQYQPQYQPQYQHAPQAPAGPPSSTSHGHPSANLNTNEFLPQPEKLTASSSGSFLGPYSLRQYKGRF